MAAALGRLKTRMAEMKKVNADLKEKSDLASGPRVQRSEVSFQVSNKVLSHV